jgi:integrase
MSKLTKRIVESAIPQEKDLILWDSELSGFCCKITPTGKRIYMLYYRSADRRQRKPKIGDHGVLSCEEARSIAQRWLYEASQGRDPSTEKQELRRSPAINDLKDRYMKEHAPHKKPSSRREDEKLWQSYILPVLGKLKVSSLTRADVLRLHHDLKRIPTTANRVMSLLSKALNLAELWGYRPDRSNPCLHVKKYPENKRERFLSSDEIDRLMVVLDEEEDAGAYPWALHAIRLLLFTGCRLREILTLTWDEVELNNQCLRLLDSKTGKKVIYLSSTAIELFRLIPRTKSNPYVICGGKEGTHFVNLHQSWRRIQIKAKLEDVRLHDLRHTFASIAVSQGLSLPIIGALLGHKHAQTTARYAHLMNQPLLEASEKIAQQIGKMKVMQ